MNEQVRIALQEIADRNGGRLTPDDVVVEARNPQSVLHELFNWDIEQAAMSHWRDRAREIIRSVRVEIKTDTTIIESVAYVRDPDVEPEEQGYISTVVLRDDKEAAKRAISYEFGRAEAALERAREIAIALDAELDVVGLVKRLDKVRTKVVGK